MNTSTAEPIRVIGYVRVSTNKQEVGPEVQIGALEAEATRNGWDLTIRREDAASAKSLQRRPVLGAALDDLRTGRFDALAVSKLDRLSRSVADFSAILELADRQRWAVIALDLRVDTTTVTGRAMAQVTCTFAEMERRRIGERTREGMARIKATTGKHMGRPSTLATDVVRRVIAARKEGRTLQGIADDLNSSGIATATGRSWTPSTVRAVVTSETARVLA